MQLRKNWKEQQGAAFRTPRQKADATQKELKGTYMIQSMKPSKSLDATQKELKGRENAKVKHHASLYDATQKELKDRLIRALFTNQWTLTLLLMQLRKNWKAVKCLYECLYETVDDATQKELKAPRTVWSSLFTCRRMQLRKNWKINKSKLKLGLYGSIQMQLRKNWKGDT